MGVFLSSLALLKSHFEFFDTFRVVTKRTVLIVQKHSAPFTRDCWTVKFTRVCDDGVGSAGSVSGVWSVSDLSVIASHWSVIIISSHQCCSYNT